jgi:hypothetical protein
VTGLPKPDGGGDFAVRTYRHTDPTTATDRRRIREARIEARERVREVRRDDAGSLREIFRQEIGTNVRSASPFLLSLVASRGVSIDRLAERIEPAPRWPRAPALSARPAIRFRCAREPYRRFVVSTSDGDREAIRWRGFGHGTLFMQARDDWACLEVVDHSLELEARIGPVKFETLFGVLRIELDHRIPDTLAAASVGRAVGDVVDHPALRGRRWMIASVEEPPSSTLGQALVVETGSVSFRMPWMR